MNGETRELNLHAGSDGRISATWYDSGLVKINYFESPTRLTSKNLLMSALKIFPAATNIEATSSVCPTPESETLLVERIQDLRLLSMVETPKSGIDLKHKFKSIWQLCKAAYFAALFVYEIKTRETSSPSLKAIEILEKMASLTPLWGEILTRRVKETGLSDKGVSQLCKAVGTLPINVIHKDMAFELIELSFAQSSTISNSARSAITRILSETQDLPLE